MGQFREASLWGFCLFGCSLQTFRYVAAEALAAQPVSLI